MAFHIAQVNIALPKGPIDSPVMAEFAAALEPVNADSSPGFVWRLQDEDGDATSIRPFEDERLMINLSVWESVKALWRFVYDSGHLDVLRRRREWFEHMQLYMCLWWIPAGHSRTRRRRRKGSSSCAATGRPTARSPSSSAFPLRVSPRLPPARRSWRRRSRTQRSPAPPVAAGESLGASRLNPVGGHHGRTSRAVGSHRPPLRGGS